MKFLSMAALAVVILTTSGAASDENFVKMTTFPFQCRRKEESGKMATPQMILESAHTIDQVHAGQFLNSV